MNNNTDNAPKLKRQSIAAEFRKVAKEVLPKIQSLLDEAENVLAEAEDKNQELRDEAERLSEQYGVPFPMAHFRESGYYMPTTVREKFPGLKMSTVEKVCGVDFWGDDGDDNFDNTGWITSSC